MSIHKLANKIKGLTTRWSKWSMVNHSVILTILLLVVLGSVAFILGYFAGVGGSNDSSVVISCSTSTSPTISMTQNTSLSKNLGNFVASISGQKYYPVDCSAAGKIKDENKLYFNTEQEAMSAGYTRALNCK